MNSRSVLAGLVGAADRLGENINRRKDARAAQAFREQERKQAQEDALALIAARAAADPKAAPAPRNPVTIWAGDKLLQYDESTKAWLPAMMGSSTATPSAPTYQGHVDDDAAHGADAAMGALTGQPPMRVPVTKPPTTPPAETLYPVVKDGKTVYVPRSQAAGMEAPRAANEPNLVTGVGSGGQPTRMVDRPGIIMPSEATVDKPATDAQNLAAGFADRMAFSAKTLAELESNPQFRKELVSVTRSPSGGGAVPMLGNWMMTPQGKAYKQAQENWVRANLRKESGAAIGDEERASEVKTYFPQPGDTDALIQQKAELRRIAEANMRRNAGRAGQSYSPDNPFAKPPV